MLETNIVTLGDRTDFNNEKSKTVYLGLKVYKKTHTQAFIYVD